MLSEFDQYLCHQFPSEFEKITTGDLRFYDRYFTTFFDEEGVFAACHGIAVYPNTGVMDGFACVTLHGETQINLRVSRTLRNDRHVTRVGPVGVDIVEPLSSLRLTVADNDMHFTFDILCEAIADPAERKARFYPRKHGRIVQNTRFYTQPYRCTGSLTVHGEEIALRKTPVWAIRDHSWGIRANHWDGPHSTPGALHSTAGLYPLGPPYAGMWMTAILADEYVDVALRERAEGGRRVPLVGCGGRQTEIVSIERSNVELDPATGLFQSCDVRLTDRADGSLELRFQRLSTSWERGHGYVLPGFAELGSPFRMGKPMGDSYAEGEIWSLSDPGQRIRGMCLHPCAIAGDGAGYGFIEVASDLLAERPDVRYEVARSGPLTSWDA